ncbi:MAG: hypothetical protein IJR47_02650 [Clostridia bacterium]|nr:hypothetical protein [Clostridia bacterium]
MAMTIEEKLKEYILTRYKSIRQFAMDTEVPYSTIDGILKRGINNSSVSNALRIFKVLDISGDEVIFNGRIVPNSKAVQRRNNITELDDIIKFTKINIEKYRDLTIDGKPLTKEDMLMLLDGVELSAGIIKKKKERDIQKHA